MSVGNILCSAIVIFLIAFFYNNVYLLLKSDLIPTPEDVWWGSNRSEVEENIEIHEFKLEVNDKEIQDVYNRLNLTRYPKKNKCFQSLTHEFGMNANLIKNLMNFIKEEYNFTQRIEYLNSHPQYVTNIQGLDIHFVHIRPQNISQKTILINVLLLHGWPSGPSEFFSLIPLFARHGNYSFQIVIPSLPGYGFSETPRKMHVKNIAVLLKNLMKRLDIEKFYVHGSDWGAIVGSTMATLYPDNVLGYHSNFCLSIRYKSLAKIFLGSLVPSVVIEETQRERLYPLSRLLRFYVYESGYLHILGSKPDTVAIGFDNSLEALLAFNLEKWSVGADKNNIYLEDGGLNIYTGKEQLLDIPLFYYWFPKKYSSAARIYSDNLNMDGLTDPVHHASIDSRVPCGCIYFKNEFLYFPEFILRDKFSNLLHYKTYDFGGHFAAMEETTYKHLFTDFVKFIEKTRIS